MATFELVLLLGIAILISAVIDQVVSHVSLPLIQIVLGIVIALLAVSPVEISLGPDLFLLLFVAPLLFHDAKKADKHALWRNKGTILSLAIGLVVAIMLCVGFFLNWIVPSIPLAAAFALGAALGPTDAVAVTSLFGSADLNKRENALLEGEALINDATGVVGFQFSIAAVVTGTFSLVSATVEFIIMFFGGILLGILLALILHFIQDKVRNLGLESTTFFVLYDVMTPFLIYLLSEICHVSGILAVVAAGLVIGSFSKRRTGPAASRLNIVSDSVWRVLLFVVNGVVFTLLGMQLPHATQSFFDLSISNFDLICYVLALTFIVVAVRFLWLLMMNRVSKELRHQQDEARYEASDQTVNRWDRSRYVNRSLSTRRQRLHSALVTTIGGPKGMVTLSIVFSIPILTDSGMLFPRRNLIIFLASGVIICTLLLANFLLPVLAPKKKPDGRTEYEKCAPQRIELLQGVISKLSAAQTEENAHATQAVIRSIRSRITRIRTASDIEMPLDIGTRVEVIRFEQDYIMKLIDDGECDPATGYREVERLAREAKLLDKKAHNTRFMLRAMQHPKRSALVILELVRREFAGEDVGKRTQDELRKLRVRTEEAAIEYLSDRLDDKSYPENVISTLMIIHENNLSVLEHTGGPITSYLRAGEDFAEVQREALQYELEGIQDMCEAKLIPHSVAKTLRDNVYLMQMDNEQRI